VRIELPYGRTPYVLDLDERVVELVEPAVLPPPLAVETLIEQALDHPIGRGPLGASPGARVTVIVSDTSRVEPRGAFLAAVRERLPSTVRWTIAIATGTHGPCDLDRLGIAEWRTAATIVNHDGHSDVELVDLGVTQRGTPVRVHRCVADADLVVATGCIRPHYFAGFGAGVKAIFPGLGAAAAVRQNHRLKTDPRSRAGIVDDNPCRADLEDAVSHVATPTYLLDGICGPDDQVHAVVAGDPVEAFRMGAHVCRPWFSVKARPAELVIASDGLPVTASLYQAAKIAAAAAPLVAAGGTLVIVAECGDGIGPIDIVNDAILRIGVLPRLAAGVRLVLVSGLDRASIARTLMEYGELPVAGAYDRVLVIPRASQLICEAAS
jgi:nickel-dependent lactate racemase